MAYTAEQLRNIRLAQKVGSRVGASPVEQKAAVEAMLVESGARNLNYGDRDSVGILQQRPSAGWHNASNPARALADFYAAAKQHRGQGLKSGALAQAVQRSAFPDRYAQRAGEAAALISGNGGPVPAGGGGGSVTRTATTTTSGNPNYAQDRQSLLLSYLTVRDQPDALLNLATGLQQIGSPPKSTTTYSSSRTPGAAKTGGKVRAKAVTFDGKPVRSDFAQELAWARQNGWQGTVTSGFRTRQQQMAAATNYGLQHYGPQGPLGSNHVVGHQGAVDVTNPEQLNKVLKRYPGRRTLIWGGPVIGDRPHFSPTGH